MEFFPHYLVIGSFAGLMAGLLGIGGGLIIVPGLLFVLKGTGLLPDDYILHIIIGTSLASIIFTALSSIYAHHRHGNIIWPLVYKLTPAIIVGAALGAFMAQFLKSDSLQMIFAIFLWVVSAQMIYKMRKGGAAPSASSASGDIDLSLLPHQGIISGVGVIIGAISSIVGIGGGSMTVPFLNLYKLPFKNCVAVSAVCGLPLAISGATGFILTGWHVDGLPPYSTGFIYWPALIGLIVGGVICAPFGAKLTQILPVNIVKGIFALFLIIVGINLFF